VFAVFFGLLADVVLSPVLQIVDIVLLSELKDYRLVNLVTLGRVGGNGVHQIHSFVYQTVSTLTKLFVYQESVVQKDALHFVDYSNLVSILLSEF
jgi:hypothetical protein